MRQIVPLRDITPEELASSDGSDPSRPMLISIRGVVYDVTKGKDFYGPGGECACACVCVCACRFLVPGGLVGVDEKSLGA